MDASPALEPLSRLELEAEAATALPAKEVMSLLDLNVDIDLALDLVAPIDLAVAGNLNVAAPINAAVAANVLSAPLKAGRVRVQDLAEVQGRREWPTRFIQAFGAFFLERVIGRALRSGRPIRVPRFVELLFRLPLVPKLVAWLVAFGLWQVHVRN